MLSFKSAQNSDLTTGSVLKKILVLFLPIAAGTCIQQLYNAADALIVSRFVGTEALAAVGGTPSQLSNFLVGFFTSLTMGAAVVIAQLYGAGKKEELGEAIGNATGICLVIGLAVTAAGVWFAPDVLKIMKTPAEIMEDACIYLRIYFSGAVFVVLLNMESNMFRAVGDSFHPFVYMAISCLSNIVLDLLFVGVFGWGVAGAAYATVLAQIINMTLLTVRLLRTKEDYRLRLSNICLRGRYLRRMLYIGIPAGLQESMYSISNIVIQTGINSLGTLTVAAWSMTAKVDGVYWAVISAMGAAVTAFVGQNVGAGNMERVRQCVKDSFRISMFGTVLISAFLLAAGKKILGILTEDNALVELTYYMMTFFVPYYFLWTIIEVISSVLRGTGDAVVPTVITGLGICVFRILWVLIVFRRIGSVASLCICYVISWVITDIALLIRYKNGSWTRSVMRGQNLKETAEPEGGSRT